MLIGCVGDDFLDDKIAERISIDNPISEIQLNDAYQINATFFNNVGVSEIVSLQWSSSNPTVISIDNNGFIMALSEGTSTITVTADLSNGSSVTVEQTITVVNSVVDNNQPTTNTGVIITTSSYILTGNFRVTEVNVTDLDIQIDDSYRASTSLPGLYLYLSNNPNSIAGALEVGKVTVFSGAHNYRINNTSISQYKYLLYWCKPFSVKVGHGEFND